MRLNDYIYTDTNEIIKKVELQAIYDSRKSFYKKAYILYLNNDDIALLSYNTIVLILHSDGVLEYNNAYSQTSNRHIKEFIKQFKDNIKNFN